MWIGMLDTGTSVEVSSQLPLKFKYPELISDKPGYFPLLVTIWIWYKTTLSPC